MNSRRTAGTPRSRWAVVADVLLVAVFFALVSGLGESAAYAVTRFLLGELTQQSPDIIWMAPVAYAAVYLPVALILAAVAAWRRSMPLAWPVAVFASITAVNMLIPHRQIAGLAILLLAAGVGVECYRRASAKADTWRLAMRRIAAVSAIGIATASTVLAGARTWLERRDLAVTPVARSGAPNILLIVLDTVRRANLGVYGYHRRTSPRIDQLAAGGVSFAHSVSTAAWSLPSHASLFTGLFPDSTFAGGWRTPARLPPRTLAALLRAHGYATGGFTANLIFTARESGLAEGFTHYDDALPTPGFVLMHAALLRSVLARELQRSRSVGDVARALWHCNLYPVMTPTHLLKPAPMVTAGFLRWQESLGGKPFFAFLNYFEAHEVDDIPASFQTRFTRTPKALDRYDGAISYLDTEVGRLLDSLRNRRLLDNTIVIITSDHGEQFGEHRLYGHANSLYRPLLAVPVVIWYPPAVPAGLQVKALVSTRELASTIAELAGLEDGIMPGRSLAALWRPDAAPPTPIVVAELEKGMNVDPDFPNAHGSMLAVRDERYKYVRVGDGREELYDYRTDTLELMNLARRLEARQELARLRSELDSVLADWRHERQSGQEEP